ncbi:MAG TPA: ABC transporter permease, partial [Acidimicrobiales bacterium]
WGTAGLRAVEIFPRGRQSVGNSSIQFGEIGLFVVMLVVATALYVLIQRTDMGLIMRGTAESRLAASLMGVNPDRITSLTWAVGGALAALAGILLAAVTSLHPYTLALQVLPAFIAALIGGLGSMPGALVGAAIVGSVQGLVPLFGSIGKLQGAPQLFLAVLAIVVMATRGKALVAADDAVAADTRGSGGAKRMSAASTVDDDTRRRRRRVGLVLAIIGLVAFPYLPGMPSSVIGNANQAAIYSIIAVSLVMLTGWVGQISLGHAALVGIGAYSTGHIVEGLGIPFPLSLPLAALASGVAAATLGAVALRVRGLYLAVATLVFAWMASEFLFRQDWFTKHAQIGERPIGRPGELPFFDFSDRRTFFLVAAATAALVIFAAANLRDSKTGRAFFALRGSEMAAASLGVDVMRYKFTAFVTSGVIAGAAGNLIMTDARVVSPDQFTFNISLFYVAVAVVGGLTSLPGAVASGVLFSALSELFYRVEALGAFLEIVSSLLLAVVLIAYRGGLASLPGRLSGVVDRIRVTTDPILRRIADGLPEQLRTTKLPHRRPGARLDPARLSATVRHRVSMLREATRRLRERLPVAALRPVADMTAAPPLNFREALHLEPVPSSSNGHAPVEVLDNGVSHAEELVSARTRVAAMRPVGPRGERAAMIEAQGVTVRF